MMKIMQKNRKVLSVFMTHNQRTCVPKKWDSHEGHKIIDDDLVHSNIFVEGHTQRKSTPINMWKNGERIDLQKKKIFDKVHVPAY